MERFDLEKRRFIADTQDLASGEGFKFSVPIFKDIGRGCLVAILDLCHANPQPRV